MAAPPQRRPLPVPPPGPPIQPRVAPPLNRLHHKVSFGAPARNEDAVRQYMTYENVNLEIPGGLGPLSFSDSTQVINADLLQIISKGINNIVDNLKRRLGKDFNESNTNAGIIRERLDQLKTQIDIDINNGINMGPNNDAAITLDTENNYALNYGVDYLLPDDYNNPDDINNINADYIFQDLDTAHNDVIYDQEILYDSRIPETDYNQGEVENRLRNCQNLEFLYLKKHDEIMKIFSFTLNLFDKYKYAINVMLFLLKHLVYKDPAGDISSNKIKMPRRIIKNIKKLLEDQKKVQGVIDKMKTVIVDDADINSPEAKLQRATSSKPDGADVPQADRISPVDETTTIIPKIPLIPEQQPAPQLGPAPAPAPAPPPRPPAPGRQAPRPPAPGRQAPAPRQALQPQREQPAQPAPNNLLNISNSEDEE
jgi:hypothetical protein